MARIPEALVTDNNLLKITHALLAQRCNGSLGVYKEPHVRLLNAVCSTARYNTRQNLESITLD